MPRLLGVEIPAGKRIEASLTYIYGIGPAIAKRILDQTNIDPNLRAKNLTPQQLNEIIHSITSNQIAIEGDLRREVQGNLKRLQLRLSRRKRLRPRQRKRKRPLLLQHRRKIFRLVPIALSNRRSSRPRAAKIFTTAWPTFSRRLITPSSRSLT